MIRNNTKSRCAAGILCLLLLFVLLFTLMTWLLFPLHLLPEEIEVLQCLQQTPAHVLPVCGCQRPLLCCGVLGRQHKEEGCGEEGGSCCGHRAGLPHNGGGEKDPE